MAFQSMLLSLGRFQANSADLEFQPGAELDILPFWRAECPEHGQGVGGYANQVCVLGIPSSFASVIIVTANQNEFRENLSSSLH